VIENDRPDLVAVCGADHVYRMDPRQMIDQYVAWGAGITIAAIGVPRAAAVNFGVVRTESDGHCCIERLCDRKAVNLPARAHCWGTRQAQNGAKRPPSGYEP
jgi:glucose-1-phosphate adenylyltransferase